MKKTLPSLNGALVLDDLPSSLKESTTKDPTNRETAFGFQVLEQDRTMYFGPNSKHNSSNSSDSRAMKDIIQTKASMINNMREILFPVFICVFVLMDILMLAYRFTWLLAMFRKAKAGVEEKVATDPVAGKILFTLTGNDAVKISKPAEKQFNHIMDIKSDVFAGKSELYLMYIRASQKSKEEMLRELWTHKQRQKHKTSPSTSEAPTFSSKLYLCLKFLYKHLISPIFWRFVLVGAFVLVICLIIKATNDLVTMETATFLMDTKSIFPQLHRQTEITNSLLEDFLVYSNKLLREFKHSVDLDLYGVNSVLQSSLQQQVNLVSFGFCVACEA